MKKLQIYLDYERPAFQTAIYWYIEDEDGLTYWNGVDTSHNRRVVFVNPNFATATLALSFADRIMMIANKVYDDDSFDIEYIEIVAMEQDHEYTPMRFDTKEEMKKWFEIGGAFECGQSYLS